MFHSSVRGTEIARLGQLAGLGHAGSETAFRAEVEPHLARMLRRAARRGMERTPTSSPETRSVDAERLCDRLVAGLRAQSPVSARETVVGKNC